jgi:6-phosphogluconate dehydrogenase
MKIGFIGLGKMGSQMVVRLLNARHEVVAYDVNEAALRSAKELGATTVLDHKELVAQLDKKPVIWLMVPAKVVDDEVRALLADLPAGSIIIDGGNSDYRKTLQRYSRCLENDVELIDVGTSGGVLGLNRGFSMMVGGTKEAFTRVEPVIKTLASPGGYRYFGPTGTGHYIKMVHNAIEYGLMESYAEGYRLLREGPFQGIDLAHVADVWQRGSIIASNLNGLAGDILAKDPKLTQTDGIVAETGEANWASEVARGLDIDMPSLDAAIAVRETSEKGNVTFATRLLAALRHAFGGHAERKNVGGK